MELFGLVSIVDEHTFGDEESFREQFMRIGSGGTSETALNDACETACARS
jgi:adenine-specific DNA-methyltransferase